MSGAEREALDLRRWRSERLGAMKARPEYQRLSRGDRQLVDYLVRAREHPRDGAFVNQRNLAEHFKVARETVNRRLARIVAANVLTVEVRYEEDGRRTSNAYRLNDALLATPIMSHDATASHAASHRRAYAHSEEKSNTYEYASLVDAYDCYASTPYVSFAYFEAPSEHEDRHTPSVTAAVADGIGWR